MIYRYPQEVHDFVREHAPGMRDEDLAEACNKALGTSFTKTTMKCFRGNHGYKNGLGPYSREEYRKNQKLFPQGLYEFVRDNSWGVSSKDMAAMANEKFGTHFTQTGMKQYRQRNGIKSGVTGWYQKGHPPGNKGKKREEFCSPEVIAKVKQTEFKKGHKPQNEKPVGTIVIRGNDKLIKVQKDGTIWERWKYLGRYNWEQAHGPIPKGMCITFLDGDNMNCELSNLALVTKEENAQLNGFHYRFQDPDLTETALNMLRVKNKAKEKSNEHKRTGRAGDKGKSVRDEAGQDTEH